MSKKSMFDESKSAEIVAAYLGGEGGPEIARRYGVKPPTIYKLLHKAGIEPSCVMNERGSRPHGKRRFTDSEEREIVALYEAGFSLRRLAEKYGTAERTMLRLMKRQGQERRSRHIRPVTPDQQAEVLRLFDEGIRRRAIERRVKLGPGRVTAVVVASGRNFERPSGPAHWRYKGGKAATKDGYMRVQIAADDPLFANMAGSDGYVMEHRLVMARHIGRPLLAEETVHHKDGDRSNNGIDNLELFSSRHPAGSRVVEQIAFCLSFLATYRDTPMMDEARRELPCPVCGSTKET